MIKTIEVGGEGGWDAVTVDGEAHRLYVPRSTRVMVIDTETGKAVGEIPDTTGVHAGAEFDPVGFVLSASGEGTLTVISTTGEKKFEVVQTLTTAPSARTLTIDTKNRLIYLPAAELEEPTPSKKAPKHPKMKTGTFKIVVVSVK